MGTAIVTARYSGVVLAGQRVVDSLAIQEVGAGAGMILFSVTRGWRFWKVGWSCRRARAESKLMPAGRGVSVERVWVEVKTGDC